MRRSLELLERVTIAGWVAAVVSAASCSSSSSNNQTPDSGAAPDTGAAHDAGPSVDAGADHQSAADAGMDAGPSDDAAGSHNPVCVPSGPEICDGKDNDCDGVIDNGFEWQGTPVGDQCSAGFGVCMNIGKVICANATTAACSASPGTPPDNSFHTVAGAGGSWDWNCNNGVDRKYPLAACESFTAANCPASGWAPAPGTSGDCGEQLVQKSCAATGSGCASTGSGSTVVEGCK